ncbi:very short patch repair endonuclease [Leifsonia sp. A12D58]|uniref:very short patch repair endonuclease n=1 Tax=Leifsonia sp. A12D58 TaxID=3397674 RepID=UPI0039DFEE55
MQASKGRDTSPEIAVRVLLHAAGCRAKIAVFIDGCFWHGCPVHYQLPSSNRQYWSAKHAANVARDADTIEILTAAGWTVLRFWEHEDPHDVASAILAMLDPR